MKATSFRQTTLISMILASHVFLCKGSCSAGFLQAGEVFGFACKLCPAGTFCPSGADTPSRCPANTYSTALGAQDSSTCTPCPSHLVSMAGARSMAECQPLESPLGVSSGSVGIRKRIFSSSGAAADPLVDGPAGTARFGYPTGLAPVADGMVMLITTLHMGVVRRLDLGAASYFLGTANCDNTFSLSAPALIETFVGTNTVLVYDAEELKVMRATYDPETQVLLGCAWVIGDGSEPTGTDADDGCGSESRVRASDLVADDVDSRIMYVSEDRRVRLFEMNDTHSCIRTLHSYGASLGTTDPITAMSISNGYLGVFRWGVQTDVLSSLLVDLYSPDPAWTTTWFTSDTEERFLSASALFSRFLLLGGNQKLHLADMYTDTHSIIQECGGSCTDRLHDMGWKGDSWTLIFLDHGTGAHILETEFEYVCPPGTHVEGTGRDVTCQQCGIGSFKSTRDSARECSLCPEGTATAGLGATSARECGCNAGYLQAGEVFGFACKPCPAGTFCPSGADTPSRCPANTYSTALGAQDSSTCTPCPSHLVSMAGARSMAECQPLESPLGVSSGSVGIRKRIFSSSGAAADPLVDGPAGTARFGYPTGLAPVADGMVMLITTLHMGVVRRLDLGAASYFLGTATCDNTFSLSAPALIETFVGTNTVLVYDAEELKVMRATYDPETQVLLGCAWVIGDGSEPTGTDADDGCGSESRVRASDLVADDVDSRIMYVSEDRRVRLFEMNDTHSCIRTLHSYGASLGTTDPITAMSISNGYLGVFRWGVQTDVLSSLLVDLYSPDPAWTTTWFTSDTEERFLSASALFSRFLLLGGNQKLHLADMYTDTHSIIQGCGGSCTDRLHDMGWKGDSWTLIFLDHGTGAHILETEFEYVCPPGTHVEGTGRDVTCQQCGIGSFKSTRDSARECSLCPEGTATAGLGATSARECGCNAGYLQAGEVFGFACKPCPAGTFCPSGADTPSRCPANTYSTALGAQDSSTCTPCPSHLVSMAGARSMAECQPLESPLGVSSGSVGIRKRIFSSSGAAADPLVDGPAGTARFGYPTGLAPVADGMVMLITTLHMGVVRRLDLGAASYFLGTATCDNTFSLSAPALIETFVGTNTVLVYDAEELKVMRATYDPETQVLLGCAWVIGDGSEPTGTDADDGCGSESRVRASDLVADDVDSRIMYVSEDRRVRLFEMNDTHSCIRTLHSYGASLGTTDPITAMSISNGYLGVFRWGKNTDVLSSLLVDLYSPDPAWTTTWFTSDTEERFLSASALFSRFLLLGGNQKLHLADMYTDTHSIIQECGGSCTDRLHDMGWKGDSWTLIFLDHGTGAHILETEFEYVCPPGTHVEGTGRDVTCQQCGIGSFKSTRDSARECSLCPEGTATAGLGATSARECGCNAGYLQAGEVFGFACKPCPAGTFCPSGADTPSRCPANTYSTALGAQDSSTCTPCPSHLVSMAGARSMAECQPLESPLGVSSGSVGIRKRIFSSSGAAADPLVDGPAGTARFGYPTGLAPVADGMVMLITTLHMGVVRRLDLGAASYFLGTATCDNTFSLSAPALIETFVGTNTVLVYDAEELKVMRATYDPETQVLLGCAWVIGDGSEPTGTDADDGCGSESRVRASDLVADDVDSRIMYVSEDRRVRLFEMNDTHSCIRTLHSYGASLGTTDPITAMSISNGYLGVFRWGKNTDVLSSLLVDLYSPDPAWTTTWFTSDTEERFLSASALFSRFLLLGGNQKLHLADMYTDTHSIIQGCGGSCTDRLHDMGWKGDSWTLIFLDHGTGAHILETEFEYVCPPGTHVEGTGRDVTCQQCGIGSFKSTRDSARECSLCPEESTSAGVGSTSVLSCQCNTGFSGPAGGGGPCVVPSECEDPGCAGGEYRLECGGACRACEPCAAHEYRAGCQGTSAGTCRACEACNPGEYRIGCDGMSAGRCTACPLCEAGQYRVGCSGLEAGGCAACGACPDAEHRVGCQGTMAGTCSLCTECSPGEFRQGCSPGSSGSCVPCEGCSEGEHRVFCQGESEGFCVACGVCNSGEFRADCGGTSAGTCATCSCDAGSSVETCGGRTAPVCKECELDTYKPSSGPEGCTPCGLCPASKVRVGCAVSSPGTCGPATELSFTATLLLSVLDFSSKEGDYVASVALVAQVSVSQVRIEQVVEKRRSGRNLLATSTAVDTVVTTSEEQAQPLVGTFQSALSAELDRNGMQLHALSPVTVAPVRSEEPEDAPKSTPSATPAFQVDEAAEPSLPIIPLVLGISAGLVVALGGCIFIRRTRHQRAAGNNLQMTTINMLNPVSNEGLISPTHSHSSVESQREGHPINRKLSRIHPEEAPASIGIEQPTSALPLQNQVRPRASAHGMAVPWIDYSEIKVLGDMMSGSFKSVYKATWTHAEEEPRMVALLVLRSGSMRAEKTTFEKLGRHPSLTRLLAVCTNPSGQECLVTEFAEHGSLDAFLQRQKDAGVAFSPKVLVTAAMQICDGMAQLALYEVIHRDLAARNVLVFRMDCSDHRQVTLKITDYGLTVFGASVSTVSPHGGEAGPLRWMAPEAIARRRYTQQSDVFAFGVTLWEMWTMGEFPWSSQSDAEVARMVQEGGA